MFRELFKISKKICINVENSNFDTCVSPKISKTPPEQCAHYTP